MLFREHPADTLVFTLGPLVVAVALVGNAVVHDLSPVYPAGFAVALAAYSALVTRHHPARVRLARLQSAWTDVESSAD